QHVVAVCVAYLDIDLGELNEMPPRGRGLQRLQPYVGRDVEDPVKRQQRRLFVQDHAGHELVVMAVEVDVDLLRAAYARIGDGPDDQRLHLCEAVGVEELATGHHDGVLDA